MDKTDGLIFTLGLIDELHRHRNSDLYGIFRDGLDQWRNYEPWLGPLVEALGPVLPAYPDAPAV